MISQRMYCQNVILKSDHEKGNMVYTNKVRREK